MNTLEAIDELHEFDELEYKIKLYQPKTWIENLDEKTVKWFRKSKSRVENCMECWTDKIANVLHIKENKDCNNKSQE